MEPTRLAAVFPAKGYSPGPFKKGQLTLKEIQKFLSEGCEVIMLTQIPPRGTYPPDLTIGYYYDTDHNTMGLCHYSDIDQAYSDSYHDDITYSKGIKFLEHYQRRVRSDIESLLKASALDLWAKPPERSKEQLEQELEWYTCAIPETKKIAAFMGEPVE